MTGWAADGSSLRTSAVHCTGLMFAPAVGSDPKTFTRSGDETWKPPPTTSWPLGQAATTSWIPVSAPTFTVLRVWA